MTTKNGQFIKTAYYKLTAQGSKAHAFASYKEGLLHIAVGGIDLPLAIPMQEQGLHTSGLTATPIKPRTVAEKVALFVMMYKEYRNVVYTASKIERANLRHVIVSEALLKVYLTAKEYPLAGAKGISDYIRNYNAVRDLEANGRPVKASFPDVYDREYERALGDNVGKLQLYWQHLRGLGWRKKDGVWGLNLA